MRVLVAGSVPPPSTGHRAALLEEVVRLRREGHDVEVVSLDHVAAAHRYIAVAGLPAALEVGLAARRFDRVVVQIEPGLPVRLHAGRVERAAALIFLALALRRLPQVTLRLDGLKDLPGGPGGRAGLALWGTADRIELGSQAAADVLAALLPDARERLTTAPPGGGPPIAVPEPDWRAGPAVSAADVNEVVRRRAAATRQALGNAPHRQDEGLERAVRVEQWEWLPAPELGVPDLGPLRSRETPPLSRSGSMRSAAAGALAAADRHSATRPVARLARLALSQLRRR